jgi:restriction system protein
MKSGAKRIAIGRCVGLYTYLAAEPQSQRHVVKVNWEKTDIPRSAVKQDLLYIFGGALSYFQAKRNDAVWRTEKLMETGVDPGSRAASTADTSQSSTEIEEIEVDGIDVVETARDVIRAFVMENFKGHKLSELTAAILEAHGLTCVISPPGPDKGIDILAGSGPLGLDAPRIVVQCKSEVGAVSSEVVQKLLGVIQGVNDAQQGLLVAFGGINGPARQLLTNQQYRVKVWDTDELIDNLLAVYDRINPEIRSEIPLQQVWTLASASE